MRALSMAAPIMIGLVGFLALAQAHGASRAVAFATEADASAGIRLVADSRSTIVPNLPGPALGDDASPQDFLRAAQGALAAGRTREAQQALEMAQTRMLDRSVPYGQTNSPSENPAVGRVSQALRALSAGDRAGSLSAIQQALAASP